MARLTVPAETLCWAANSVDVGSGEPGANSPRSIVARSSAASVS
jgi:hypothetical protein